MKKPLHRDWRVRVCAIFVLLALLGWFGLPWLVPMPDAVADTAASPVLRDRHGEALHHLRLGDYTRHDPVRLDQIPDDLIACTIAVEDKRYWNHGGVDVLATARSVRDMILNWEAISGASTITQQLAKLSQPPRSRNVKTKLREMLQARRMEMVWTKDEILTSYFNRLDYGNLRIGPAEAARWYFQKPLDQLSLGECALLAGLPQAPSRLNPIEHLDRALRRREIVLDRLEKIPGVDKDRVAEARAEIPMLRPLGDEDSIAPWLPRWVSNDTRVSIDAGLQSDVQRIAEEELDELKGSNLHHMAVVVVHNPTGEVLALVSAGEPDGKGLQLNGATNARSPGSALKPFTYALAFGSGRSPGSIIADIPTRFRTLEGLDLPENYDRKFRGPVTIREALACSLNVPALRELNRLGGPDPLTQLLQKMDVLDGDGDFVHVGLGLTIGGAPVRLIDLTNAYATIARGGVHMPVSLKLGTGDESRRIFGEREAWLVADIMADSLARAPQFGRGGPLELPFPCAAKTGTSSDYRDNWCLGFTKEYAVGVWAGNFDNTPMRGVSGVDGAGPVFNRVMQRLHRDVKPTWLEQPAGLVQVRIDPRNGKQVGEAMPGSVMEWYDGEHPPLAAQASDYDPAGRVKLDKRYIEWLASDYNRRREVFVVADDVPNETPLRVLAPRPGAVYVLDPELPNGGFLHLASNLPGLVEWSCETLVLRPNDPEPVAVLTKGKHILRALDPRSGEFRVIPIEVEAR